MTHIIPIIAANNAVPFSPKMIAQITLWVSGFLCGFNILLAIIFRKRRNQEIISYWVASIFELAVFVFALLWLINVIPQNQVPWHLPPNLPINRAQIGAALAIGIGLFPAAFWHRVNVSDLPGRIAHDALVMKEREGRVHVPPGEWMN